MTSHENLFVLKSIALVMKIPPTFINLLKLILNQNTIMLMAIGLNNKFLSVKL